MLIYCSHKFGGKLENAKAAETKIKKLQLADPGNTYMSPIHAFGFMYNDMDYDVGLRLCLDLLAKCDAMIVLSEGSRGVVREIDYCKANKIPYIKPSLRELMTCKAFRVTKAEEDLHGLQENLQ